LVIGEQKATRKFKKKLDTLLFTGGMKIEPTDLTCRLVVADIIKPCKTGSSNAFDMMIRYQEMFLPSHIDNIPVSEIKLALVHHPIRRKWCGLKAFLEEYMIRKKKECSFQALLELQRTIMRPRLHSLSLSRSWKEEHKEVAVPSVAHPYPRSRPISQSKKSSVSQQSRHQKK
jgi:hypothetical protein